jgi:fucose 4-O-acetylase-like acetyltransferase
VYRQTLAKTINYCIGVLGHTAGLPTFAMNLIYSFHMPLFFFPLHQLMFSVFTGIGLRLLGLPATFKASLAASLVYTLLALVCSIPVAYLLRHFVPFMIGERIPDRSQG